MDLVLAGGCLIGGLFGLIMSFYLILCFISWLGETFENTTWRWKK